MVNSHLDKKGWKHISRIKGKRYTSLIYRGVNITILRLKKSFTNINEEHHIVVVKGRMLNASLLQ